MHTQTHTPTGRVWVSGSSCMEKHQTQLPPGAASTISPPFSFSLSLYLLISSTSISSPSFVSLSPTQTERETASTTIIAENEHRSQSALLAEMICLWQSQKTQCVRVATRAACARPVSVIFPQNGDTSAHHHLKARTLRNIFLCRALIEGLPVAFEPDSTLTPV